MQSSAPRFWRERHSRYRLRAVKCKKCGKVNYPPSNVCRFCGSKELEKVRLDKEKAKLITWTIIHTVPDGFDEIKPRIIGIVETLESKVRILAPITDVLPEELKEDIVLEPVLRRISEDGEAGIIHYGIAYRPVITKVGGEE